MNTEYPAPGPTSAQPPSGTPEEVTTELPASDRMTERIETDEATAGHPAAGHPAAEHPQVWSAANTTPPPAARRVRSGTLVFGIILTLIGLWSIAAGFGLRLDAQLGTAAILVAAAFGLLIAGITRRSPTS